MNKKDKKEVQEKVQKIRDKLSEASHELRMLAFPLSVINKHTIQLGHAHNALSLAQSILTEMEIK